MEHMKKIKEDDSRKNTITNGSASNGTPTSMKKEKAIYLRNLQDDTLSVEDTLHHKAFEDYPHLHCHPKVCYGSMMRRDGVFVKEPPPKQSVWEEAQKFLNEYYDTLPEKVREISKRERMEHVYTSIVATGTYVQTLPEVKHGAQLAWRNAPRCVGRIQWSNMQMFDCRNAQSTQEMFEAILAHIKYATNNGIIRSAITLFGQTVNNKPPNRIWNPQFLSFAGYPTEDGKVLGDPANLEFTKICLKLGWKGKRTRFDILPFVLQYGDDDPELFELPEDMVLRVKLRHPKFKQFADMKLEWYAVPAVSNMYFDCGGIVYNSCGFNGWYMTTEILKDLSDPSRYDLLQEIAENIGLDTNQPTVFWKDIAAVELNIAITYSFQKDRVTIVDHHTASESFMRHFANETKVRGGCPSDWVWINPPIGGSLTQVHHQEMLNYKLKPGYDYQPPPWANHVWKDPSLATKKKTFTSVAKTVGLAASLMSRALMKRIPCTILYASETGISEHFAYNLRKVFNQAFNAKVVCMSDYDYTQVRSETLLIVVASTFGNGDPPENGRMFLEVLSAYASGERRRRSSQLQSRSSLNNLHANRSVASFAVFGLGSSAYPNTFCEFGRQVDEYLADGMSFSRMLPFGTGDALKNQEKEFSVWSKQVFQKACEVFCIDTKDIKMAVRVTDVLEYNVNNYRVVKANVDKPTVPEGLKHIHNKTIGLCKVKSVNALTRADATKETILVELNAQDSLPYNPGDHVAVFPTNNMDDVELILKHTILPAEVTPTDLVNLDNLVPDDDGKKSWETTDRLPVSSMKDALTYYLDIDTPPGQSLFKQLVANNCVDDEKELEEVKKLANDDLTFRKLVGLDRPSIAGLLRRFPNIFFPPTLLLSQLPTLRARFYSVSSAPSVTPNEIHITAAVLEYETPGLDGKPVPHAGLCTNWLKKLSPGSPVHVYIRSAPDFWLPENKELPVIMVGPGSGVAPYRSFWLERQSACDKGEEFGEMELFYGCRGEAEQCFQQEMEQSKSKGVFSDFHVAYSRKPGVPKTYVQHDLETHKEKVRELMSVGGHFYVCGDITMAYDVADTLCKILDVDKDSYEAQEGDEEPSGKKKTVVDRLKASGRYKEDIYGVSSVVEGLEKLQGM